MGYADLFHLAQKGADVTLVTGPIFIKFAAQNVATILPLSIFQSELQYCNPFWNTAVPTEC